LDFAAALRMHLAYNKAELGERLDPVLESHSLPIGGESPLWKDDFSGMCDFRINLLAELLTDLSE
jgi:hypothetical protein